MFWQASRQKPILHVMLPSSASSVSLVDLDSIGLFALFFNKEKADCSLSVIGCELDFTPQGNISIFNHLRKWR